LQAWFLKLSEATKKDISLSSKLITVDHVIPQLQGGRHHPLNCLLYKPLNSSFKGWYTLDKKNYIGAHVMRHITASAKHWLSNVMAAEANNDPYDYILSGEMDRVEKGPQSDHNTRHKAEQKR
jgi:hypothetical protein